MKLRILVLVFALGLLLSVSTQSVHAAQPVNASSGTEEPYSGAALCLPDAYLSAPAGCLPLGPSQTLSDLAEKGLTYPPRPLPAVKPPRELTISPVTVAKVNVDSSQPAYVYATLEDAMAGTNPVRSIAPGEGLRYVSYITEERDANNKPFVMLKTGEWMRASPAGYSYFQGLLFSKTPSGAFGWMIDTINPYSAPSFTAPQVSDLVYRETPIQIYDIVEAEGMEWYMIGENRWVPHLKARRALVDTTPPEGVTGDRWISVDLFNQIVMVYENRQLVFATLVSTGSEPFFTRPGTFQIYEKKPLETMRGAFEADRSDFYYLEDVPYTMYFDEARALHGAYWRAWFGVEGTHGCVNFSIGDAAWLYNWANEGDWVYVWDPSGRTPTDPSFYGAGGA
ncbi:MAG: L,D-transpeptidase [Chloroflexi bacterium]|nr:L,D-transpeptidase [Chloroflexota bacterium]